jgi:hypothetical protein
LLKLKNILICLFFSAMTRSFTEALFFSLFKEESIMGNGCTKPTLACFEADLSAAEQEAAALASMAMMGLDEVNTAVQSGTGLLIGTLTTYQAMATATGNTQLATEAGEAITALTTFKNGMATITAVGTGLENMQVPRTAAIAGNDLSALVQTSAQLQGLVTSVTTAYPQTAAALGTTAVGLQKVDAVLAQGQNMLTSYNTTVAAAAAAPAAAAAAPAAAAAAPAAAVVPSTPAAPPTLAVQ